MAAGKPKSRAVGSPRTRYALTDMTTPVSGLFRLAETSKSKLEASEAKVLHDGVLTVFTTPYRLGPQEWRVLLAVSALAGLDGEPFTSQSSEPPMPTLWDQFLAQGMAGDRKALRLRTTAYALLREVGLTDGGENRKSLSDCLDRLSKVSQTMRRGNQIISGANLLSFAADEDSGEITIALSPQTAKAVLGEAKQHIRISLVEVRQLDNSIAVLIHAFLSARISRAGSTATYPLDHLVTAVYGEGEVNAEAAKKRRQRVRKALEAFERTTWRIEVVEKRDRQGKASTLVKATRSSMKKLEAWERQLVNDASSESGSKFVDHQDLS